MATLSDIVSSVADQLARYDLNDQITREIGLAVARYSRKLTYLTEVRGGVVFLNEDQTWYPTLSLERAAGLQDTTDRVEVPFSNVVKINHVRFADAERIRAFLLQDGNPLLTEDGELLLVQRFMTDERNWRTMTDLEPIHYTCFERHDSGWPIWGPWGYCVYAGQFAVSPWDRGSAVYVSANVKPLIPDQPDDTSVFFDEARELIEAAAAKGVCAKYIQDIERASTFGTLESQSFLDLQIETNTKASTGKIMARW